MLYLYTTISVGPSYLWDHRYQISSLAFIVKMFSASGSLALKNWNALSDGFKGAQQQQSAPVANLINILRS